MTPLHDTILESCKLHLRDPITFNNVILIAELLRTLARCKWTACFKVTLYRAWFHQISGIKPTAQSNAFPLFLINGVFVLFYSSVIRCVWADN